MQAPLDQATALIASIVSTRTITITLHQHDRYSLKLSPSYYRAHRQHRKHTHYNHYTPT
jgi:hypothetical protein